ncbi:MAG: glycosyltransferase family 9 protein [bacterium]|nr:glycosyltransferase family 9 protein [bacterium]
MKSAFYREKWSNLKSQFITPYDFRRLSQQIAYSFMDAYLKDCHYEDGYIELLCEMTTFSQDIDLSGIAARALFSIIIESLCDDFEDLQTETYNSVMAQIISYCRKLRGAKKLDRYLQEFQIYSRDDLLIRINKIRMDNKKLSRNRKVEKILLLSRVTIGADVVITSIIIQRLAKLFPAAELVLIGGDKLDEIYGGNSNLRLSRVAYNRKGGLLGRLSSWQSVLNIIDRELADCPLDNTILIDPDSRLSQLGVLPIIDLDHYFFFDSRSAVSFSDNLSMAQLTNAWLNNITDEEVFCHSMVWPIPSNLQKAAQLHAKLKSNGARRVITLNFGVGGNPRKKVGERLELDLLLNLLQEPNTVVLLDKGFGDSELQSSESLIAGVKANGFAIHNGVFDQSLGDTKLDWGVIGLQTRIGEIAAIIANCDEYIGYDSACQHIAAASRTPCLTIFAGSNNMRFIRRWSAYGSNTSKIVHVDTLSDPSAIDVEDIIIRIMNERRL